MISTWGLDLPGVHRLELYVEPWNDASRRTAEHAGYEREGLLRSWQVVGDERRDMYMYSLLRTQHERHPHTNGCEPGRTMSHGYIHGYTDPIGDDSRVSVVNDDPKSVNTRVSAGLHGRFSGFLDQRSRYTVVAVPPKTASRSTSVRRSSVWQTDCHTWVYESAPRSAKGQSPPTINRCGPNAANA